MWSEGNKPPPTDGAPDTYAPRSTLHAPRIARLVTDLLAPSQIAALMLGLIAWRSAETAAGAIVWGGVAVLFAAVLPFAYLLRRVRRRAVTDLHVRRREQRPRILLVGLAGVLVAFGLLLGLGAPPLLVAAVGSGAFALAVLLAITLVWKISIHVGVVTGAAIVLILMFGPLMVLAAPLVHLVAWSRVAVGDHTPAQAIGGGLVGAAITLLSTNVVTALLGG